VVRPSFPCSARECPCRCSASSRSGIDGTRSVRGDIPTQSVGTRDRVEPPNAFREPPRDSRRGMALPHVRGLDFLLRTPPSGSICARSRQPSNPRGLRPNAFPLPRRSSHFLRHSTAGVYRAPHPTPPARPATERSQWQAGQAPRCSLPDVARAPLPEKTKPMASWVEPEDSRGIAERSSRNSTSRGRTKPTASWVDLPGRPTLCRAKKTKPMAIWERVPAPSPVGRAATERSQWRLG